MVTALTRTNRSFPCPVMLAETANGILAVAFEGSNFNANDTGAARPPIGILSSATTTAGSSESWLVSLSCTIRTASAGRAGAVPKVAVPLIEPAVGATGGYELCRWHSSASIFGCEASALSIRKPSSPVLDQTTELASYLASEPDPEPVSTCFIL